MLCELPASDVSVVDEVPGAEDEAKNQASLSAIKKAAELKVKRMKLQ
jgi:hypothetical protein